MRRKTAVLDFVDARGLLYRRVSGKYGGRGDLPFGTAAFWPPCALQEENGVLPWLPVLASVGGFIFMMTRPAEGMKSGAESSLASLWNGACRRAGEVPLAGGAARCFAVSLVAALWYHARREKIYLAAALVLGSLCANFALSVASYYPERCLAFPAVLLIAADAVLCRSSSPAKRSSRCCVRRRCSCCRRSIGGVFGFADITNVYLQVRANETAVTEAAARGENSVTVPYIETLTRYSALYDLKYLDTEDAQSWPNDVMADVFGIGEIRGEPDATKEAE